MTETIEIHLSGRSRSWRRLWLRKEPWHLCMAKETTRVEARKVAASFQEAVPECAVALVGDGWREYRAPEGVDGRWVAQDPATGEVEEL